MDGLSVPHDDDVHGSDLDASKVMHVQMPRGSLQSGNVIQTVDGQLIQVHSTSDCITCYVYIT